MSYRSSSEHLDNVHVCLWVLWVRGFCGSNSWHVAMDIEKRDVGLLAFAHSTIRYGIYVLCLIGRPKLG